MLSLLLTVGVPLAGTLHEIPKAFGYSISVFAVLSLLPFSLYLKARRRLSILGISLIVFLTYAIIQIRDFSGVRFFLYNLIFISLFISLRNLPHFRLSYRFAVMLYLLGVGFACLPIFGVDFWSNSNFAAASFFCLVFPALAFRKIFLMQILLFLPVILLLLFLGSKSVLLAFTIALLAVFSTNSPRRWVRIVGALTLLLTFGAFVYVAYGFSKDPIFWNQVFLDFSGKRLDSGRLEIWTSSLSERSWMELIFGTGKGGSYVTDTGDVLSVHSSYVFLLLRVGVIGLVFFLFSIFSVIRFHIKAGHYWAAVLIIFFLIRDLFETTLVANNFPLAAVFWAVAMTGHMIPVYQSTEPRK